MATLEIDTHNLNSFSPDDFETASIRSAAPSYISEAPSYHTTVSTTEPIPPYSPPEYTNNNNTASANAGGPTQAASGPGSRAHNSTVPSLLPSHTAHIPTPGLPPIPPVGGHHSTTDLPSLGAFRIPSWSTVNTNPTYHRVANRRAQAAMSSSEGLLRNATRILERVNEEVGSAGGAGGAGAGGGGSGAATPGGDGRVRPLEDPYLVGEVAAARARRERLARENGDDVLHSEDRRWDWFLAQTKDWEERDVSWKQFRRDMQQTTSRGRLARRIGAGR
ncbi:hypothetical protein VMCG_08524 [Cytospora schulzeri]|uniref:Uncharacterized protein n=1 Tax=Cytospora schulzeri TaxID=448051 RepID=A0A423VWQ9_9PEZI|nr:hypothetical protein VMCG_08524 [Valsa malicola]